MNDRDLVSEQDDTLIPVPLEVAAALMPASVGAAMGTLAKQLDREANIHAAVIFNAVADAAATIAEVGVAPAEQAEGVSMR